MKNITFLIASIMFLANAEAQYITKKNVADFNAIEVSSVASVNLIQSDSNYVTLSSKNSFQNVPEMEIKGGVLEIGSSFVGTLDVHVKNITSIRVSDGSRLICKDTLKTNNLTIRVSDAARADILAKAKTIIVRATGGSSVTYNGAVDSINANASDASKADMLVHAKIIKARANDGSVIILRGSADSIYAKASDASRIDASTLKTDGVKAVSSDGSKITAWVINNIDADAKDASLIVIKGNPKQKNTSATDGASITMDDTGDEIRSFNQDRHSIQISSNDSNRGINIQLNGDAFIGGGFVTGGSNGVAIKYGNSREFMMGFGYTNKITNWNWIGLDLYYKSTDYYLAQNNGKSFPDSIHHQSQKVSFQNFGGLLFDRFFLSKKIFLDGGIYGDWTFHSKLVTWDDNVPEVGTVKTIDRNLGFVKPTNYGLTFRFGYKEGISLYFNYRLSKLFQNLTAPAPAYPNLPVYTIGINIGSFD